MPRLVLMPAGLGVPAQYPTSGTVITRTIDVGSTPTVAGVARLSYSVPAGTTVTVTRSRSSADGSTWGVWVAAEPSAPSGHDTTLNHTPNRFVQVEIKLETSDVSVTPVLDNATVRVFWTAPNWNEVVWS